MHLSTLRISQFRCLETAELTLAPGLNAVAGDNGSGKTSLIEAIHYLARADSFRPGRRHRLVRDGAERAELFALLRDNAGNTQRLGIDYTPAQELTRIRHQGQNIKVHELVRLLPVLFVDPVLHQLLEEGPPQRRRFLDWGVFHVEHDFFDAWRRYRRALQQRNNALRSGADVASIAAWEPELCATAEQIDQLRQRQVERLHRLLPPQLPDNLAGLTLDYRRGWSRSQDMQEALASSRDSDREAGFTRRGPHRADLRVQIDGYPVPERASRGEQKVITIALHLAQAGSLAEVGKQPIVLIDDLAAELGEGYQRWLEEKLRGAGYQTLLSFIDQARVPTDARLFHVEHGRLTQVRD